MKDDTHEMKAIDACSFPNMVITARLRATVGQIELCVERGYLEYIPDGHLGITEMGLCIL